MAASCCTLRIAKQKRMAADSTGSRLTPVPSREVMARARPRTAISPYVTWTVAAASPVASPASKPKARVRWMHSTPSA
jgi:hypothetical protein